jgi:hypothetical protein
MGGLEDIKRANARERKPAPSPDDAPLTIRVSPQVMAMLQALRDTGFFGNGTDVQSVAEELLRLALRQNRDFIK